MKFIPKAIAAIVLMAALVLPAMLPAQSVQFREVGRPSLAFFEEHPEFAGIHSSMMERLNIEEGDAIKIIAPNGNVLGAPARAFGRVPETIYLNQRMRNILGIEDGVIATTVQRKAWPTSHEGGREMRFARVLRPPEAFLDHGDAVGMSLADMERLGAGPGMRATIEGPGGTATVTLQLLDRGPGTILMKLTLRRAIGIDDGDDQDVRLVMQPSRVQPSTARPGSTAPSSANVSIQWLSLPDAASEGRRTGRPLLLVVEGPRASDVKSAIESAEVRGAASRCHLTTFNPATSQAMAERLGITNQTSVVFLTGSGQVLSRMEGIVTPSMISAAIEGVLSSM